MTAALRPHWSDGENMGNYPGTSIQLGELLYLLSRLHDWTFKRSLGRLGIQHVKNWQWKWRAWWCFVPYSPWSSGTTATSPQDGRDLGDGSNGSNGSTGSSGPNGSWRQSELSQSLGRLWVGSWDGGPKIRGFSGLQLRQIFLLKQKEIGVDMLWSWTFPEPIIPECLCSVHHIQLLHSYYDCMTGFYFNMISLLMQSLPCIFLDL